MSPQEATKLLDDPAWPYPTAITQPICTGGFDEGPAAEQLALYVELRAGTLAAMARKWRNAAGSDVDAAWSTLRSVEGAAASILQLLELQTFAEHCGHKHAAARAGWAINAAWRQVQTAAHELRLITAGVTATRGGQ